MKHRPGPIAILAVAVVVVFGLAAFSLVRNGPQFFGAVEDGQKAVAVATALADDLRTLDGVEAVELRAPVIEVDAHVEVIVTVREAFSAADRVQVAEKTRVAFDAPQLESREKSLRILQGGTAIFEQSTFDLSKQVLAERFRDWAAVEAATRSPLRLAIPGADAEYQYTATGSSEATIRSWVHNYAAIAATQAPVTTSSADVAWQLPGIRSIGRIPTRAELDLLTAIIATVPPVSASGPVDEAAGVIIWASSDTASTLPLTVRVVYIGDDHHLTTARSHAREAISVARSVVDSGMPDVAYIYEARFHGAGVDQGRFTTGVCKGNINITPVDREWFAQLEDSGIRFGSSVTPGFCLSSTTG